jgi:hypothetical protein
MLKFKGREETRKKLRHDIGRKLGECWALEAKGRESSTLDQVEESRDKDLTKVIKSR